jgi:hypothetical protein
MTQNLYKLEAATRSRIFIETVSGENEGAIYIAACAKHAGETLAAGHYFKTFFRLFDADVTVQTKNVKFSESLLSDMYECERADMCAAERQAFNNQ